LWSAARVPAARQQHHPTTVAGEPAPSTSRAGRNLPPYCLGVPPQGWLADVRGQFSDELAERVHRLLARPGVVELSQVARLSDVTFPGEDLLPGASVAGFHEAWNAIIADWNGPGKRPGDFDRWHVESHILDDRDILVTDDLALRTMCNRLRKEHGFDVHAESLEAFVARCC